MDKEKMKEYLYQKAIRIPLYRGYLVIILSNSQKKLSKISNFFEDEKNIYSHYCFIDYKGWQGFSVVFNFHNNYSKITHGAIAHEAAHAAHAIMNMRGIDIESNNDEPVCYLVDWITEEIYKFIKQYNFRVN